VFGKEPDRFGIGNDVAVGKAESEKDAKGNTVTDQEFGIVVGEVIEFFEYEDFEHEDNIEGRSSAGTVMFLGVDFVENGTKHFPIDQRVEFGQKVVALVDFIELLFEGEEGVLTGVQGKKREGKGKHTA